MRYIIPFKKYISYLNILDNLPLRSSRCHDFSPRFERAGTINPLNINVIQRDIDEWISDQVLEIWRSECSSSFKCGDGLYRIVVTSDYPEKSKDWRPLRLQNHISKILCDTIIEAERDIKLNDILS